MEEQSQRARERKDIPKTSSEFKSLEKPKKTNDFTDFHSLQYQKFQCNLCNNYQSTYLCTNHCYCKPCFDILNKEIEPVIYQYTQCEACKNEIMKKRTLLPNQISSPCNICRKSFVYKSFLCNHGFCLECLIEQSLTQISCFYYNRPENNTPFYYYCPLENCKKKITVPTSLVLSKLRNYMEGDNKKFWKFADLINLGDEWVQYLDGIYSLQF